MTSAEREELGKLRHMRAMMVDAYVRLLKGTERGEVRYAGAEFVKSLLQFGPVYPEDGLVRGLKKEID